MLLVVSGGETTITTRGGQRGLEKERAQGEEKGDRKNNKKKRKLKLCSESLCRALSTIIHLLSRKQNKTKRNTENL